MFGIDDEMRSLRNCAGLRDARSFLEYISKQARRGQFAADEQHALTHHLGRRDPEDNTLFEPAGVGDHGRPELIHRMTGMEFTLIPSGEFTMGSEDYYEDERPVHVRLITKPQLVAKCPITQGEWTSVMDENPSYFEGSERLPVESISWHDVQEFCERTGLKPLSEAVWEYACRAGTTGDRYGPLDEIAVYGRSRPEPVGSMLPNPWGLYDTLGNVWEWCADPWHPNYEGAPPDERVWDESWDHRPDPTMPSASSAAAAGSTPPGTRARRFASGTRRACAAGSWAPVSEAEQRPDPTESSAAVAGSAPPGSAPPGTCARRFAEGTRRASATGTWPPASEAEQRPDPTALPCASCAAAAGSTPPGTRARRFASGSRRVCAAGAWAPVSEAEQRPDPTALPSASGAAAAGSSPPGACARRVAAGSRRACATGAWAPASDAEQRPDPTVSSASIAAEAGSAPPGTCARRIATGTRRASAAGHWAPVSEGDNSERCGALKITRGGNWATEAREFWEPGISEIHCAYRSFHRPTDRRPLGRGIGARLGG